LGYATPLLPSWRAFKIGNMHAQEFLHLIANILPKASGCYAVGPLSVCAHCCLDLGFWHSQGVKQFLDERLQELSAATQTTLHKLVTGFAGKLLDPALGHWLAAAQDALRAFRE
jgi:hypothetical protein